MRNETRILFNNFAGQVAKLNGVGNTTAQFSVAPVVEQKLEEVIKQSSEFLQKVNVVPVIAQEGAKVGLGVTRPIASRTRTDPKTGTRRRQLRDEPDYEQIADYQSVNESYVVEDYGLTALVQNIVLGKKPA